ncbi:MAG: hypothetical protein UZ21_OP11001000768 [Microgenomates bacterium OLB22]|nr:MAG: hypothetical protein UZ21_OP11001000768 [Microgenomates bacterium OLB22]
MGDPAIAVRKYAVPLNGSFRVGQIVRHGFHDDWLIERVYDIVVKRYVFFGPTRQVTVYDLRRFGPLSAFEF